MTCTFKGQKFAWSLPLMTKVKEVKALAYAAGVKIDKKLSQKHCRLVDSEFEYEYCDDSSLELISDNLKPVNLRLKHAQWRI